MDVSLILRVAGIGLLIGFATQILNKTGRDEQAMLVTITGIIVVFVMLIGEVGTLISTIKNVFGL